jgi:ACR3 family arsenite efflux pump ArsB
MEDEVGVFKFVLRFVIAYSVCSLLVWLFLEIWSAITNREITIYFEFAITLGALAGAATVATSKFIRDNKGVPTSKEKSKLIWFSFVTSWLLQVLLFCAAIVFLPKGKKIVENIQSDGLFAIFGVAIFISVFYLGLLSLNYGEFAKKRFEIMQKKGQI